MSVRVMTAVWDIPLSDSEKIVLLALADCANDEGHCWPSMATLARKCSKSDRTVQAAIKSLVDAGHLTRREVPGKGCNYTVHPRSGFTPEAASPPKGATGTPEAASDKPSKNHHIGDSNESPRGRNAGKHLLPKDWKLPAIADLPPKARACAELWTKESYETHGEAFTSYWWARRGMYSDWDLTWGNRVIALHSQVMRDQKFGNAPPTEAGRTNSAKSMTIEEQRAYIEHVAQKFGRMNPDATPPAERIGKPITLASLAAAQVGGHH
jgi:hypothetical protein